MNILFVSVRRSVTAKPLANHHTIFGKCYLYVSQNSISKVRSNIKQTRLIVCERPLQEHTHTSALVTTPRVTENDAPYLCVYVCVVCVGGSVSNKNILLSQREHSSVSIKNIVVGRTKEHSFPNETQRMPSETSVRPPHEKIGVPHQYT